MSCRTCPMPIWRQNTHTTKRINNARMLWHGRCGPDDSAKEGQGFTSTKIALPCSKVEPRLRHANAARFQGVWAASPHPEFVLEGDMPPVNCVGGTTLCFPKHVRCQIQRGSLAAIPSVAHRDAHGSFVGDLNPIFFFDNVCTIRTQAVLGP